MLYSLLEAKPHEVMPLLTTKIGEVLSRRLEEEIKPTSARQVLLSTYLESLYIVEK